MANLIRAGNRYLLPERDTILEIENGKVSVRKGVTTPAVMAVDERTGISRIVELFVGEKKRHFQFLSLFHSLGL